MKRVQPKTIGPYQIVDTLGRGGMGVVYRARDLRNDQEVALKTVHVPHEGYINSLRREISALAALAHPGIVSILDQGVFDGAPWYAMELVSGPTLRAFRNRLANLPPDEGADTANPDWWTQTLELLYPPSEVTPSGERAVVSEPDPGAPGLGARAQRRILRVLLRLCETLAVLHAAGIVHADLKPENVLVRRSDRPVLVDFGLTARFVSPDGREPLDARLPTGGSFAYMAPEQIRGELFDARADLYAFGCLLFEMVAGRRAFPAERPHELILAQMALDPPPLSSIVADVSPELEALVDRLLAKEPRFRLGHARAIAANLASLIGEPLELGELPPPHLYRPTLVGRHRAMRLLKERVRGLRDARGGLVVLCGETGVGKTRLLAELGSRIRQQGMLALSGECHTVLGASPSTGAPLNVFEPVLTAVADRCRQGGSLVVEALLADRGPVLAAHFDCLAGLPGVSEAASAGELLPNAARLRLYRYLLETLDALVDVEGPVTLLLDDLHRADELTVGLLRYLGRGGHLDERSVLIIGTCRTRGRSTPEPHPLGDEVEVLYLERLDEEAIADMTADMLGLGKPPVRLAAHLTRTSGGNPFFVAQYLRAAQAEGLLTGDSRGQWQIPESLGSESAPLPVPSSIWELLATRHDQLGDPELRLVSAAAVLSREASWDLLAQVADLPLPQASQALQYLVDSELLIQSGTRLDIAHGQLREVAYTKLGDGAAAYHRRAARALEARPAERISAAELGEHLSRAGDHERARPYLLNGARQAIQKFARREAERLYRAFLAACEAAPTPDSINARVELARDVLAVDGRLDAAIACVTDALSDAVALGDRRRQVGALCQLSNDCQVLGRIDDATAHAEQALEIAEGLEDEALRARVLNRLATLAMRRGQTSIARKLGQRALDLADRTRERVLQGDTRALMGVLARARGELAEAERHGRAAVALHRKGDDPVRLGVSLAHLGNALEELGQRPEAAALNRQALAIFRKVGDRRWEAIALGNLASIYDVDGDRQAAAQSLQDSATILDEVHDQRSRAISLTRLAGIRRRQGRLGAAESLYEQAMDTFRVLGDRAATPLALCGLAGLRRRRGAPLDEVAGLIDEADIIAREGASAAEQVICLCERGHLALARGRSGNDWLEQAVQRAEKQVARRTPDVVAAIERLAHAVSAAAAGRSLVYGDDPDTIEHRP